MPGPKQNQNNQDYQAHSSDGIKTPFLAMRPDGKRSDQRYDHKYGKNKHDHHILCTSSAGLTGIARYDLILESLLAG
jgi:hypothetical protein